MLKLLVLVSLASLAFGATIPFNDPDRPIINTRGGDVQGERLSCGIFCNYFSFKGIPYATPPMGNLRFRAPVPHPGWTGVRQATEHGSSCVTSGTISEVDGSEDCLFLNVYTQNLIGRHPVMVWIHGGSFTGGSGNSLIYGPDHLVAEDVLIVTINYRVGILGFFSTGDRFAQGNWGMKDMVEALRWVRDNIGNFGGDPDNVTIFGESAGGVAIHYLVLSSMAAGLYHKAIAQSGTALVPWGFQPNPREVAFTLRDRLGLTATTTEQLVAQLRVANLAQFAWATQGWLDLEIPRGFRPFEFVINVEAPDALEPRFLTATPFDIMNRGAFNRVPFMIGYNDAESLFMIRELLLDNTVFDAFNANPDFFVPYFWNVAPNSPAATEISNGFRNFYWGGVPLSQAVRGQFSQYQTDHQFIYGIDKTVQMHSDRQGEPIYYYKFTFDGDLNLVKRLLLLTDYPGAVHADELFYMWSATSIPITPLLPTNPALAVRRRVVRMWTNFAKFSDPTFVLDATVNIRWPQVLGTQEHMNIGVNLVPGRWAMEERINVWQDLERRFANWN